MVSLLSMPYRSKGRDMALSKCQKPLKYIAQTSHASSAVSAAGRLKQEDYDELKVSLGYIACSRQPSLQK